MNLPFQVGLGPKLLQQLWNYYNCIIILIFLYEYATDNIITVVSYQGNRS